jgi:3-isopropylmalate/(R)-2-methylmalate dehydratase small subunit
MEIRVETMYSGKVWKFGDAISTDLMVPGALVLARRLSEEDAAQLCMNANRPDWAQQVQRGDILVAGRNFGCGSSRNASAPLKTLGIAVVLVESAARIHLRNAINTGLPTLVCPGILAFVEEGQHLEVDIVSGKVTNVDTGGDLQADRWPADSPPFQIMMAGGFMPYFRDKLVSAGLVSAEPVQQIGRRA